jgi:hypothetical protein
MRPTMKRFTQWMILVCFALSAGVVFQNCGTYQPEENDEFTVLASGCLDPATCIDGDAEAITLEIGNADPERLLTSDKAFDVGGYCDPGGFQRYKIVFSLKNPAGGIVLGPLAVAQGCDAFGRFRIRVDLPPSFNYTLAHTLVISLVAIDARGTAIENPLGLNRRELGVIAQAPLQ